MCGIVAVINKGRAGLYRDNVDLFTQLLFVGQLRGSDGTGVFYSSYKETPTIEIVKTSEPAADFLGTPEYSKMAMDAVQHSSFIVGHNRSATKGKLNLECTHPFKEKHITLVHNGTLYTQEELKANIEVDSHAICHSIADIGVKETVKKINGAFALVWFDEEAKTLNLCRNFQRPLYLIETASLFVIVSELEMGEWILKRNDLPIIKSFLLIPEKLYSFSLDNFSKYNVEELPYKKAFTVPVVTPVRHTSKNKNKHTMCVVGDFIKFKAGALRTHYSVFIEGDLLLNPTKPISQRNVLDYEDEFRIRLYGSTQELEKFSKKDNLIGKVSAVSWYRNSAMYTVVAVHEEKEESTSKGGVTCCDICHEPFKKGGVKYYKVEGLNMCPDCKTYWDEPYYGNVLGTI